MRISVCELTNSKKKKLKTKIGRQTFQHNDTVPSLWAMASTEMPTSYERKKKYF